MSTQEVATSDRVPGHALVYEGRLFDAAGRPPAYEHFQKGHAKCSCGALSPYVNSKAAGKRWHREHKASAR